MNQIHESLDSFLQSNLPVVLVRIDAVYGSAPRDEDGQMLVSEEGVYGSVGGGYLEYEACRRARMLLKQGRDFLRYECKLGAEIGQCCGGVVHLEMRRMDRAKLAGFLENERQVSQKQSHVYIFGAGHVGLALSKVLVLLPLNVVLVETRAEYLEAVPQGIERRYCSDPVQAIKGAPAASAFIVVTHDHGLDFALSYAALKRKDAVYVGLIGSKTKRGKFHNWLRRRENGDNSLGHHLVCPIGYNHKSTVKDKRPAVIAVSTAAEVMQTLGVAAQSRDSKACTISQGSYSDALGYPQAHHFGGN